MTEEIKPTSIEGSKWSRIKLRLKKSLIVFIAMVVIIIGASFYWKYYHTYSNGYRTGLLQKFSHEGNVFKTYEGEMLLNNESNNMNVTIASEKFYFSVTSEMLARQFDSIQGQMVTVHYKQKNGVLFWQGETEYLVDEVKLIK